MQHAVRLMAVTMGTGSRRECQMGWGDQEQAVVEREAPVEIDLVPSIDEDDECRFQLEQRNWAEGIGWYTQKTIVLDAAQARRLQQLLAVQSPRITRALERPSTSDRGRLVPFRRVAR
jgi:hypothetical protein